MCNERVERLTIPQKAISRSPVRGHLLAQTLTPTVTPAVKHDSPIRARKTDLRMEQPGIFQCTLLRALDLPKADRDVFLMKEIQGHTLAEIAAILGISSATALARLKRARRAIDHSHAFDATEPVR